MRKLALLGVVLAGVSCVGPSGAVVSRPCLPAVELWLDRDERVPNEQESSPLVLLALPLVPCWEARRVSVLSESGIVALRTALVRSNLFQSVEWTASPPANRAAAPWYARWTWTRSEVSEVYTLYGLPAPLCFLPILCGAPMQYVVVEIEGTLEIGAKGGDAVSLRLESEGVVHVEGAYDRVGWDPTPEHRVVKTLEREVLKLLHDHAQELCAATPAAPGP